MLSAGQNNLGFSNKDEMLEMELKNLALAFLQQPEFEICENITLEGTSGLEYDIDFFISTKEADGTTARMLVKILDFKKPAGTDVINKFEKASRDCSAKGLIVSNKFSAQAISLASRTDSLQLLSRSELLNIISASFSKEFEN